jgi:hypothetical protein
MTDQWAAPGERRTGEPEVPGYPYQPVPMSTTAPAGEVRPAVPAQWPSSPPAHWLPPQNRDWNGFAIAALVLGILPGVLLAVGFGITALLQIGRRGGRGKGMAITGIVLGSLWTVFIVLGIVGDNLDSRAGGEQIPAPPGAEQHDVTTLKAGECTAKIPESDRIVDVPVIPCSKPHRDEVYAVLTIPGTKYPGDEALDTQANNLCNDKLEAILGDDGDLPAGSEMYYLAPTRFVWATGDHTITCLVEFPKDRSGRVLPG